MEAPKWPLNYLHSDFYMGPLCPNCGSDYPKKYIWFGRRYCINDKCPNYKE